MKEITLPKDWTLSKKIKAYQVNYDLSGRGRYIYGYNLTDMDGYVRFVESMDDVRRVLVNHGYETVTL
jgi:hypothetical protein